MAIASLGEHVFFTPQVGWLVGWLGGWLGGWLVSLKSYISLLSPLSAQLSKHRDSKDTTESCLQGKRENVVNKQRP